MVGNLRLGFAELEQAVGRAASALVARGLTPGDRIASWMGKTTLACVLPLAAARAGLVHVPINPVLKRAQAAHILADSGARLLIANSVRLAALGPGDRAEASAVALEEWREGDEAMAPSALDPAELAALLYTSGSTGRPKGVMLSHANLWLGAVSVAHFLGLSQSDRTLCVLPLAFDYGQNQLLSAWAGGGCAVAFDYLLPADVKKAVRRHDVTVLAGVPPLWHQLARLDWTGGEGDSLRTLTNSGGHLSEPLVRDLRHLFPNARLHLMYGLTEAFRASSLDPELVDDHPDSVGTAIPFARLSVRRADGTEAAAGEEGELVQAGPLVSQGYWRDPERTAARFRDGQVWSGDRMVMGTDGLLRFRARDDTMIKVAGNRLSPTEIEVLALASGVAREAAAFGIADAALGQAVALVVAGNGDTQALLEFFTANAPAYMKPERIVWRESLPVGPSGKLDRAALERDLA